MAVHTIKSNPSTCWLQYSPLLPFQVYSLIKKRKISDNMGAFFILLATLFLPLPILASSDVAFPLKVSLRKYNCVLLKTLPPSVALILCLFSLARQVKLDEGWWLWILQEKESNLPVSTGNLDFFVWYPHCSSFACCLCQMVSSSVFFLYLFSWVN